MEYFSATKRNEITSFVCEWTHGIYIPWNSPGQNTGVASLSLLQEIFPTQGLIPGLLHCKQILYQLSHKGSPEILEWVACPFSRGSSQPRNWTKVSCIAGGFFTNWPMREAIALWHCKATISWVQLLSRILLFVTLWTAARQASACPSPTPRACSNSLPSSWQCHPIISSSGIPFSSCL